MINKIILRDFRLFDDKIIETPHRLIIFSGKNATGKTSVLEGIYLLSTTKSHRSNENDTLIKTNKDFSVLEVHADKKLKIVLNKKTKSYFINNAQIKKASDFIGNLNVVMFSPSDLSIIDGGRSDRRKLLDIEISLIDKSYLYSLNVYKKLLKERNEFLKSRIKDEALFKLLTESLMNYLKIIYYKRIEFINEINAYLVNISRELEVEDIRLEYLPSYDINNLFNSFKKKYDLDYNTKTTNIGTHRDDVCININGMLASSYASEGQKRTICIAIKLAIKEYIKNHTGNEPYLLLDDIFAALDSKRIANITKYVKNSKQSFITTTSILEIPDELLSDALVIRI